MAVNIDIVSEKLFNILKGFGYEVKSFDKDGDLVLNPQEATRFAVGEPNLLARINLPEKTIMLATSEDLSEEPVRDMVKNLAQDYLMNFDYKVFNRKIKPKGEQLDVKKNAEKDMADVMEATLENIDQMQSTMYKSVSSIPWAMRDDWGFDWSSLKPGMDSNDAFEMFKDAVIQIRGDQGSGGYTAQNLANKNDKYYNELLKTYVQKIATMGMSVEGGTGKLVMDQVQDRLPNDTISEASLGKMTGSRKSSYQPLADSVKIIVRHNKEVNEEVRGARSRNIHSILVQRGEEKFKMAENNLSAARAMARHLHNGGETFDEIGESITEMSREFKKLKEFIGYVRKAKLVNETNQEFVSMALENIDTIRTNFKRLSGVKSYANAVESVSAYNNVELLQDDIDLESKFTETHFDDKVANAMESLKAMTSRRRSFESKITKAIESETFAGLKNLIR